MGDILSIISTTLADTLKGFSIDSMKPVGL